MMGCPRHVMKVLPSGQRIVKDIEKRDRKKWSVETARKIFELRGDTIRLEYLSNIKKADDVSDCLLMVIAFVLKKFIL